MAVVVLLLFSVFSGALTYTIEDTVGSGKVYEELNVSGSSDKDNKNFQASSGKTELADLADSP